MQQNVTDCFSLDSHLPDSFYFDIYIFQARSLGQRIQEATWLHKCCGQSSPACRRWLGGFRGSFAWDRQAVRKAPCTSTTDLLCFNVSTPPAAQRTVDPRRHHLLPSPGPQLPAVHLQLIIRVAFRPAHRLLHSLLRPVVVASAVARSHHPSHHPRRQPGTALRAPSAHHGHQQYA